MQGAKSVALMEAKLGRLAAELKPVVAETLAQLEKKATKTLEELEAEREEEEEDVPVEEEQASRDTPLSRMSRGLCLTGPAPSALSRRRRGTSTSTTPSSCRWAPMASRSPTGSTSCTG